MINLYNRLRVLYKKVILIVLILLLACVFIRIIINSNSRPRFFLLDELKQLLKDSENIIDYSMEDKVIYGLLSKDGRSDYGDSFVVFEQKDNKVWERSYENDFKDLKPWKIETADIDGNNDIEIMIAVRKTTVLDKTKKNRMFIFQYRNQKLIKKWTGSQIAANWRDFYVEDLVSAPGKELIFIERVAEGSERIRIYQWFDFGFFQLAESEIYNGIKELEIIRDNVLKITHMVGEKEETILLSAKKGQLLELNTQ
ncbi:hypothetical protein I5677_07950 [Mobilitalea sibirica]|uniref:Uncharacterized protein n=1 Tax=Mobilitalea sibirica TaxID=1462919 RepID=A0A8J7KZR9_9FIRM|nr:hypothetical protein [Mobilitalea sibirica]MBH1940818.1 hypothetical protein [Mobilitalea sibirica]